MANTRTVGRFMSMLILAMALASTPPGAMATESADATPVYPPDDVVVPDHGTWTRGHYPVMIREFKAHPLATNDVVFIGDSITEKGNDWAARFGSPRVKNRGIAGDMTQGVIVRLGEIYYYPPAAVFIMIGVNDINAAGKTPEFTAENIFKIVDLIREHSPKTKVYVQTILPTSKEEVTAKIRKANALLRMKASQHRYTLIDLHKDFADDNGLLKKEFSADGIHLKEAGYQEWVEKEKPIVDKLCKE